MKFKNKKTGIVENVTNKVLVEQYKKHTDVYELVEEKKTTSKK